MCRKLRHKKNLAQDSRPVIVEQILNKTIMTSIVSLMKAKWMNFWSGDKLCIADVLLSISRYKIRGFVEVQVKDNRKQQQLKLITRSFPHRIKNTDENVVFYELQSSLLRATGEQKTFWLQWKVLAFVPHVLMSSHTRRNLVWTLTSDKLTYFAPPT